MGASDYVPVNMGLAREYGLTKASILGAMWLRSRYDNYVCKDSAGYIAEMIGLTRAGVHKAQQAMIADELIIDLTPDRLKSSHDLQLSVNVVDRIEGKETETAQDDCQPGLQIVNSVDRPKPENLEICQPSLQSVNSVAHKYKDLNTNTNILTIHQSFLQHSQKIEPTKPEIDPWLKEYARWLTVARGNVELVCECIPKAIAVLDGKNEQGRVYRLNDPYSLENTIPPLIESALRDKQRQLVSPSIPDLPQPTPPPELTPEDKLLEQIKTAAGFQMSPVIYDQWFNHNRVMVLADNGKVELCAGSDWHPGVKKVLDRVLAGLRPGVEVSYVTR